MNDYQNIVLQHALDYAARGWRVFPLHDVDDHGNCTCTQGANCSRAGKHPRVNGWPRVATTDPKKIREWFAQRGGIGIATGAASGLTVVDVDVQKGGAETWRDLIAEHGEPVTLAANTGSGGMHFFFQYNCALSNSTNTLGKGIDVRNDGGFVVAAPSRHRSGQAYEWADREQGVISLPRYLLPRREAAAAERVARYTLDAVRRMLEYVPADDRDLWRNVGIILGREYRRSAEAWGIYVEWADTWDGVRADNHEKVMREAFEVISQEAPTHGKELTIATIVKAARGGGWVEQEGDLEEERWPPDWEALLKTPEYIARAALTPKCIVRDYLYADVAQIVGAGGLGKTTTLLYEAIHVALGMPLWGYEIVNPGEVLFISAEDNDERLTARLRDMLAEMLLTEEERRKVWERVTTLDVAGEGRKLLFLSQGNVELTAMADKIIERYKGRSLAMIVFDPMTSFGASEQMVNDNENGLLLAARRIARSLNCCVRFIHHVGKENARNMTEDQYSGRGGSAMADGTRMTAVLVPVDLRKSDKKPPAELMEHIGDYSAVLRLTRPKGSYCPPNQPAIWIVRNNYKFHHAAEIALPPSMAWERDGETVLQYLRAKLAKTPPVYCSKTTLRGPKAREALGMTKTRLVEVVEYLLDEGRVTMEHLERTGRGGKDHYLKPGEEAF